MSELEAACRRLERAFAAVREAKSRDANLPLDEAVKIAQATYQLPEPTKEQE